LGQRVGAPVERPFKEAGSMNKEHLHYEYEIYIGAPIEQVWRGLTDGDLTKQYVYGTRLQSTLKKGAPYAFVGDGDFKVVDGQILDIKPNHRLALTWRAHWDQYVSSDPESRVTYELSSSGPKVTKLRLLHDQFDRETATYKGSIEGWPLMLSSLKTFLESGEPLPVK
jgi:uncharacterized protein YndB with AHSA1/START domain